MGQKQSMPTTFFCPVTGAAITQPLGTACERCAARHDLLWQLVYVCPNTGYRIAPPSRRPQDPCAACFQAHTAVTKRVFVCPVTGAQIAHPRDTGGRCARCAKTHEDVPQEDAEERLDGYATPWTAPPLMDAREAR